MKARGLQPDLILLDIMMPKLDGIAAVRMLKADDTLRSIPVILVTAKADTQDVVEGLDAGGDDYLTKPFEHRALLARVRSMLRQKALHDTVASQARASSGTVRATGSMEPLPRTNSGGANSEDRANGPPQALPARAGRRPHRCGRQWGRPSAKPPSRGDGGLSAICAALQPSPKLPNPKR